MDSQAKAYEPLAAPQRPLHVPTIASPRQGADSLADPQPVDTFDSLYIGRSRGWLVAIMVAYIVSALSYAWNTPPWQAPDEPAHYNYVAYIAEQRTLPVLQGGDYDQDVLDEALRSGFHLPDDVASFRYEFHQPPLYYLLAVPIYWVSGGSLLALRLYSILIGAAVLLLVYLCLELVFRTKTLIVVGAAAFAALLPMHVALLSSVNNDGLAELLIVASLLVALSWMRMWFPSDGAESPAHDDERVHARSQLVLLGILLGLGMLTKVYAYALTVILLATVVLVVWIDPRAQQDARTGRSKRSTPSWHSFWLGIRTALWVAIPALALGSLWWIRNHAVYGGWDLLGLNMHSGVVADQPRTVDWIATFGWVAYGERAIRFTFQSFWGVFGWMGVFMDERIYTGFYLFTGIIFLGLLWAVVRLISGKPDADMELFQLWVLGLFGVTILAVATAYLWYNIEFVQHQGRYFFWGLLPIGTVVALGWREVMQPLQGWITAVLALIVTVGAATVGYVLGTLDKWTLLTAGCIVLLLLLQPLLLAMTTPGTIKRIPAATQSWLMRPVVRGTTRWARVAVWALPFVIMLLLNLSIPHLYILKQLAP